MPDYTLTVKFIFVTFIILLFFSKIHCQQESLKFMFYNVENLFDTRDDSLTADDDFTPQGRLHWTRSRFSDKINKISKVIIAAGEWEPPVVIGLSEIENRKVLNELVFNTSLSKFPYKVIHSDSPDERGIDVALLYDGSRVRILSHSFLRVQSDRLLTRDILYTSLYIKTDTFHVFINHWPSRSSGQLETEDFRMLASGVLRDAVDSVFITNSSAKIIIMGDFNDEPSDESLVDGLRSNFTGGTIEQNTLYNLSSAAKGPVRGTLKYQGNWNIFDQIIVSGSLLKVENGLHTIREGYKIFYTSSMIETDALFNGVKPFRTYEGFRYHGGFSDHLPVVLTITR